MVYIFVGGMQEGVDASLCLCAFGNLELPTTVIEKLAAILQNCQGVTQPFSAWAEMRMQSATYKNESQHRKNKAIRK